MNRKDIIENSSDLFYANGFKTVTMDDIAAELAVSKKTLYELFKSKENLIGEILVSNFNLIEDNFNRIQSQDLNAIEELLTLRDFIDKKFTIINRQNCVYQLQRYYSKIYTKIHLKHKDKIVAILERNFLKGKDNGIYRADIEPNLYANLFLDLQNSIKNNSHYMRDVHLVYKVSNIHVDVFIRGIVTKDGLYKYEKLTQNHA